MLDSFVDLINSLDKQFKSVINETKKQLPNYRLTIELVPASTWYNNLRKHFTKEQWDELRKQVYKQYNYRCGICGVKAKLNCHEIWEYDDDNCIQRLKGFIALCDMCHHVKHIGFAKELANKGQLNFDDVKNHFLKVNNCAEEEFNEYLDMVFDIWGIRSIYEWDTQFGEYDDMIKNK